MNTPLRSHPHPSIELKTARPADRIALRGVRLRSTLVGMSQLTTIEQTFTNLEPQPIEAVYTFPLPDGAAVFGFDVIAGDRALTGTIDEADNALDRYESAVREGHGAYLLEQHRPDVFIASVGNLLAGQTVIIRVCCICALEATGRSIRLSFPTTIAPRYFTATGTDPITAAVDGDALNPPQKLAVPYGLSFEMTVDLADAVERIASPSHQIIAERDEDAWHIRFAGGTSEMDRDVVLELALKKEQRPFAEFAGAADGSTFVAVSFIPEFDTADLAAPPPNETVFVLDCSGSMQGESIAQAKLALGLCLRSLSAGDTFNICRFGSRFELMSPEPVAYTEDTLAMSLAYVERIDADLGGTEMFGPLDAVMKTPASPGRSRQVIVLTDGQVTNEPAVIDLARRHREHNRIFSFGIGSAASHHLVRGIARATGGSAEFIAAGEQIHEKVLRTFGRLASPPITGVGIDWGDSDVIAAPAEVPPIFDGEAAALFGKVAGNRLPRTITLHCQTPAGPKKWAVELKPSRHEPIVLGRLWARERIGELESGGAISRATHASAAKDAPAVRELIALSKQFNLLCSLTMFVAVEHRSESDRADGQPALRRVPLQMAHGWHGIRTKVAGAAAAAGGVGMIYAQRRGGPHMAYLGKIGQVRERARSASPASGGSGQLDLTRESDEDSLGAFLDEVAPQSPASLPDLLAELLGSQSFGGAFSPRSRRVIESMQYKAALSIAKGATPPTSKRFSDSETVAVLLVLQTTYADRRATFQRAAAKARKYLAKQLGTDAGAIEAWVDGLAKQLKRP